MKRYIMESKDEVRRLEEQTKNPLFSLDDELKGISFTDGESVLDAGCGTGLLGRYLKGKFPSIKYSGCDQSVERLNFAKEFKDKDVTFFDCDIYQEKFSVDDFDTIISRYVFHHLDDPKKAVENFYNNLKVGGRVVIIDAEGVMLNIGTDDAFLLDCMAKINSNFHGNLMIARHLPRILVNVGFEEVHYRMDVMDFQNQDRRLEVDQFNDRIKLGKEFYIKTLGGELMFHKFKEKFLNEISKEYIPLFYNRFIVSGRRPRNI